MPQSELYVIPDAEQEVNRSAPEAVSDIIHKLIFKVDHIELALDKADKLAKEGGWPANRSCSLVVQRGVN